MHSFSTLPVVWIFILRFYELNREYDLFFCKPQNPAFSLSSSFAFAQRPPEPNVSAATAKSLQSCPTLCDPVDGSLPGSLVLGILQARTLEWVAISFSSAWKWKVKVKSLSRVRLLATPWTSAHQTPPSTGFSRQEYWSGVPLPSPNVSSMYYIFSRVGWKQSDFLLVFLEEQCF